MIKTPLSTVIGGAFWTPSCTVIGGNTPTFDRQVQKLFANSEKGFFYDPNDLTTLYQDAAGTIPVTEAGQPVGLMKDKSGRNNHAFQTVSASRPILQRNATTGAHYLAFDGVDDCLQTNNIDFTTTDKVSLFAGVRKLSDSPQYSMVCELSAVSFETDGAFNLQAPGATIDKGYASDSRGTVSTTARAPNYPAPNSAVLGFTGDISAPLNRTRVNSRNFDSVDSQGTGNFGNYPFFIGMRNNVAHVFNGHIYSLIGIGKLVSENETTAIEKELAKRTGVTLNV